MKKRIFALALALCMMVSVMPNSFAAGILSVGDGTDSSTPTTGRSILSVTGSTPSQLTNTGSTQQTGILSNNSNGGQTDYDFGTATDQSQTSMTINTGSSSGANAGVATADVLSYDGKYPDTTNVDKTKSGIDTLTKTATVTGTMPNGDSIVKIDMTAGTDSEITVTGVPCNIVLVLDASKTMKNDAATLKTAVDGFIDGVYENAPGSKIAVVGYASNATPYKGNTTTTAANALQPVMVDKVDEDGNLVKDASGNIVKELNSELKAATAAVQSATTDETGVQKRADAGLEMAVDILQAVPSNDTSKPIVILFTNGIPSKNVDSTSFWDDSDDAYGIAQDSIHWSAILKADKGKSASLNFNNEFYDSSSRTDTATQTNMTSKNNGCGATVYCVGVNLPDTWYYSQGIFGIGAGWTNSLGSDGNKVNEFLYRVSSHVKSGAHGDSGYGSFTYYDSQTRNKGYYMVAEDMSGLGAMFEQIEIEGGDTVSNVTYRDYLAPGFIPCDASGNPLSVGEQSDGTVIGVVSDDNGKVLYYYVEKSKVTLEPGKDVSLSIYAKTDDHLGGKDVRTNIPGASGIYSGNTNIGSFPAPVVSIPVDQIAPNAQSFTIYLSNAADLGNLVKLDDRLDGKKNAGVKVTYTITGDNDFSKEFVINPGEAATAFPETIINDLTECKTYTITCTVDGDTASDTDTNYLKVSEKAGTVHVVEPQLDFDDVNVYLGKTPVFDDKPALTWITTSSTSGHACGTPSGKIPDIKCTFANSNKHYLADTTVTPTANLTGTSGKTYQVVQKSFKVSVYAPVVTYQDTTIYLSENANFEMDPDETATANLVSTAWEHKGTAAPAAMGAAPTLEFNYSAEENGQTVCKDVSATAVGIDGNEKMIVDGTTYAYVDFTTFKNGGQETSATQFTVHVVKPVFTNSDTTIYLGNSVNLNSLMQMGDNWECDSDCTNKQSRAKTSVPEAILNSIDHSFSVGGTAVADEYAPDGCATYSVVTTVNSIEVDATDKQLEVHVVKPVITSEGIVIYLSNTVDLNGQMTEADDWACDSTCGKNYKLPVKEDDERIAPSLDYSFTGVSAENEDDYLTTECRTMLVSATVTGTATKTAPIATNEASFVIHVLKPSFVITCTNLWADYMDPVDLDGYDHIELDEVSWSDMTEGHTATEADAGAANEPDIDVSDLAFTFDAGENGSYILNQTADKDVNIVSASWTWDTAEDAYVEVFVKQPTFTVHVNKFDLTINKEWKDGEKAADGTYKQDAIFTVAHEDFGSFKVVLPKGESSVTVTGLLCGQDYSVTEDDAWTWRWKATKDISFTTHEHDVSTSAPTEHVNLDKTAKEDTTSVSFTNSLINRLWLSFCTTVKNIFAAVTTTEGGSF